jgi:hypothetical protein
MSNTAAIDQVGNGSKAYCCASENNEFLPIEHIDVVRLIDEQFQGYLYI